MFQDENFPNVTSRNIYEHIMVRNIPKVEERYGLFNWKVIWKNVAFKYICSYERCVMFKYVNEILPNKLRLFNMKRRPSPNCEACNTEENNLHMVYYCKEVKQLLCFLRELLKKVLFRYDLSLVKLLFLDTSILSQREGNTVVALVTNYICTIWYNRGHTGDKLYILKKNILSSHRYQKTILKDKMPKIFNNKYCEIDENFLENILIVDN